jgi:DNA-binding winged helix-turn-helix (wHTH) protein
VNPEQRGAPELKLYRFDDFCLNPLERRLTFDEVVIAIAPKALDALLALLVNAGSLVRKQDLHQRLWPGTFVEDVTLARTISDLRQILARHSRSKYIETVPKHGYRFVARVHCYPASVSGPLAIEAGEQAEPQELVLRAWHAARRWSPESVRKGLACARQAIAADPASAEAYAVLAYVYLYAGFGFLPGDDAFPRAKAAATTALRLDSRCAPAHATLGMLRLVYEHDPSAAEGSCQTAIELAPQSISGHFAYSHFLLIRGRFNDALKEAVLAAECDALSCPAAYHVATVLFYSGRYHDAIAQLLKFEYLDPEFLSAWQLLAVLYALVNRAGDALRAAAKAVELSGSSSRGKVASAIVRALLGMHAEARALLREMEEIPPTTGFRWSYARAAIYSCLNDRDAAFQCLDQACEEADGPSSTSGTIRTSSGCAVRTVSRRSSRESASDSTRFLTSAPLGRVERENEPKPVGDLDTNRRYRLIENTLDCAGPERVRGLIGFHDSNLPAPGIATPDLPCRLGPNAVPAIAAKHEELGHLPYAIVFRDF